ncbi:MAG TPA: hypothetical protein VGH63_18980 [Polyangia bacterium]|jgi:hypothetical protein
MLKRAAFALLLLLAACGGPGHVQYDNDRCLIDGHTATLGEVESRQAAVAARIQSRQPWFAIVTIVVVLVAGASNAEKATVLLRARKHDGQNRPLSERIRDALERHRQSPMRFGAIVGSTLGLLAMAAGLYIYLDVDKRASERALGMLQFCHLALRTAEEQGVLAEQRKNLNDIQSTAGDIRALVDKLPPEEKQKAREIVSQMNDALAKQGKIVGDYLTRSDEQQKALELHNAAVEKGLSSLSTDVGALKSLPAVLKDLGDGVKRVDGKIGDDAASVKALQTQLGDLDAKVQKLLARPACEPPKPSPPAVAAVTKTPPSVAATHPTDLGIAKP